jgi:hypothetical protein
MTEKSRQHATPPAAPSGTRKVYRTPRLEEYGHVAKLTQSGGSTRNEAGNPMNMRCL